MVERTQQHGALEPGGPTGASEGHVGPAGGEESFENRTDRVRVGWDCEPPGRFTRDLPKRERRFLRLRNREWSFSWLRPSTLLASRNQVVAYLFGDPTDEARIAWVERTGRARFTVEPPGSRRAFLVVCDTGEGDASQYATVPAIEKQVDTDFMIIGSDVIYPAGDVNQYVEKFYFPYRNYPGPIYAIPGNHDWYDSLNGFMQHFCDGEPLRLKPRGLRARLRHLFWRRPSLTDPATLAAGRALRPTRGTQPGPYWTMDLGPFQVVAVDPGIRGRLDNMQGRWLVEVSRSSAKPKVLLIGKPLMVDAKLAPCPIQGEVETPAGPAELTVDDIVTDPAHNYVAAVGGDIHNYQRYEAHPGGRLLHYVVAGGGGAFMHATHKIGSPDPRKLHDADADRLVLYPVRGDSLAFFSRVISRRLHLGRLLEISREDGSAIMAKRLEESPALPGGQEALASGVGVGARLKALVIRHFGGKLVQRFLSELFDWDEPPLFKSFLRFDWTDDRLTIRCIAATGCGRDEEEPPVVDRFTIPLATVDNPYAPGAIPDASGRA